MKTLDEELPTDIDDVSRETVDETPDETTESVDEATDTEEPAAELTDETDSEDDGIRKVRREAAKYRTQLREAETELETVKAALFTAKVVATGKLADPDDMPVNLDLATDDEALEQAIDALLESKPHLAARQFGNIGQGEREAAQGVSLGSMLRKNA